MEATTPPFETEGFKDEFHQRCLRCLIKIAVFQPAFILIATLLLNLVFPDPLKWIDSIFIIGSLANWMYLSLLLICIVTITVFHVHQHSVEHRVVITKWDVIWRFVSPMNIGGVAFFLVMGAVSVRCYVGLVNDQRSNLLSIFKNTYCFNEMHTFIVLHGAFSGALYGFAYYLFSKNEVGFSSIQAKHLQLQLSLPKMFINSCKTVLGNLKWFYVLYYFLGHHPRTFIMSLLKIEQSCSSRPLDSISGLFDFNLFWSTWLSAATVFFTWDVCIYVFQYYVTKHHVFPIAPSSVHAVETIFLHQALVAKLPLLKYLGYLDLSFLSWNAIERRKEIFSLSHPGGHPHNWKLLSNECISILDAFTADLNLSGNVDPAPELPKPVASTEHRTFGKPVKPGCRHGVKLSQDESEKVHDAESPFRVAPATVIKSWFEIKSSQFVGALQNWLAALHLFRKGKISSQALLANCQIHIWSVQALSFLAVHSFREDKYGIVQQDLADIVVVLCKLQQALEKKQKWISRVPKIISTYWDTKGFRMLLTETRLALNRVAVLFHSHLDGIDLSTEYKQILKQRAKCE